jgi:uncharacterized protein YndB with AHSA1/START domain
MATNISAIQIKAPVKKVWDALTQADAVKKWQYGSDMITDWKIGSSIKFSTPWDGKVFEQGGKILEMTPYKIISYSLFAPRPSLEDKPENYFIMKYILTEDNGLTNLSIIQEDNRPGAKQEASQGEENPILKGLKTLVEST